MRCYINACPFVGLGFRSLIELQMGVVHVCNQTAEEILFPTVHCNELRELTGRVSLV